jgi:hypothetical protein
MAISVKLTGVKAEFADLDEELTETINSLARIQALDTTTELKRETPVDTGRAKNSWLLTDSRDRFKDAKSSPTGVYNVLPPVSKTEIETLYVTNGTPYIEDLNQGSSRQAPARFVEQVVYKNNNYNKDGVLFETIEKEG